MVPLWLHNAGVSFLVHRLVAEAFIGPVPPGHEVNHIDGVKTHNAATNLEYLTRRDNLAHARRIGLYRLDGEHNPMAKITKDVVLAVRAAHAAGEGGYTKLSARFGLSWGTVRNVVKRKTWASV